MRKAIISLALMLVVSLSASAQRTMARHGEISCTGTLLFDSFGAGVSGGVYTLGGYWEGGASLVRHTAGLSSGEILPYSHAVAYGGFNQRLFATFDRMVNLYVGGGVFCGLEEIDPTETLPESIVTGMDKEVFLYGLYGKAEAEVFLTGHIAVAPFFKLPYCLSSQVYSTLFEAGLSLRYNF